MHVSLALPVAQSSLSIACPVSFSTRLSYDTLLSVPKVSSPRERKRESPNWKQNTFIIKLEVTVHHFCILFWFEISYEVQPTFQELRLQKGISTGRGVLESHFRGCLPQDLTYHSSQTPSTYWERLKLFPPHGDHFIVAWRGFGFQYM